MKNLPPLTKVIDKGPESGFEFERLMKKLLIHDGSLKEYVFEPGSTYRDKGIDGIVRKNYPAMECPVIFQFKWLEGPINTGSAAQQIKLAFERMVNTGVGCKSYVLVTPHDLTGTEKKWLEELKLPHNLNIDIFHYGHTKIQVLLDGYPALKKYYYGVHVKELSQDFNLIKEKYRDDIIEEVKHLHFIGVPTVSYQKQLQIKPELAKVYIPLNFNDEEKSSEILTLSNIIKKSNRVVVLGDPGSGKSTLAKYLALIHSKKLDDDGESEFKGKIPFIVPIREFVSQQQEKKVQSFNFIDYLKHIADANYSFNNIDKDFFIAYLELGKAIVLFDGLDEVASEGGRMRIANNIEHFARDYQDTPIWVTSRIAGYTVNAKLNPKQFSHYYLAPVSTDQAREFIKKWYEIYIPKNKSIRTQRIRYLQRAIEENPGVKRLKTNPLLLTMMTLVHQFEGTLPDNRARLYEKCIELLLKTWQEQRYLDLGIKNPLEERDLKYDDQLRLLSAAAYHIQENNLGAPDDDTRGLIEEKELTRVLFNTWYDKKRMSKGSAKQDIKIFLDYIRDRAGLLVEKGRNEKGENLFSFVHLSFLEYLCAYQMDYDRKEMDYDRKKLIQGLIRYMEIPAWEEPILLILQRFANSTSFIDDFTEAVIKKLSIKSNPNGWFMMGHAVRDNIPIAPKDIKQITGEIVKIWIESSESNTAFTILKEIVLFSVKGKKILKKVIKENIKNNIAEKAFKSLYLYKEFYKIDSTIPVIISQNTDYANLLAYLPVYRGVKRVNEYIKENLNVNQWVIHFNSTSDKTLENLDNLLRSEGNTFELKGYILSSWKHIFKTFQDRSRFLEQNKNELDLSTRHDMLRFKFSNYTDVHYQLTVFYPFTNILINVVDTFTITNHLFISEDRKFGLVPKGDFIGISVDKIVKSTFEKFVKDPYLVFHFDQEDKKKLIARMVHFGKVFLKDFIGNLCQNLLQDFIGNLIKGLSKLQIQQFVQSLHHYITGDFIRDFLRDFNRYLIHNLKPEILLQFSRELSRYFDSASIGSFMKNFLRDRIQHLDQSFKNLIHNLYRKKYHKELEWDDLSTQKKQQIYNLLVDEFNGRNIKLIDAFFVNLYEYLFYDKFEVLFESVNGTIETPKIKKADVSHLQLLMSNHIMIPFTFGFILSTALNRYLVEILAYLNTRFYGKDEIEMEMISGTVDYHCAKNPFILYLINFSWDYYAKAFNETYQEQSGDDLYHLRMSSFIVNAAKVSLTTGMPCKGESWEKILEKAEQTSQGNLLVNISLTLYKLCNFQEREKNSELLKSLFEKLKQYYPEEYKLLGSPYILGHI
ncbi:MAG: NACHT domain-containing protein [Candidatus Aminicenantes bacterium]|jgi:tRNA uridine 5-carbamoylmethylation protein Kti12